MNYKKILIVSFICMLCFSIMPISNVLATTAENLNGKTITLQGIAENLNVSKEKIAQIIETEAENITIENEVKENNI